MVYEISEKQNKDVTRVYRIVGPRRETVESFWKYLVEARELESFTVTEREG